MKCSKVIFFNTARLLCTTVKFKCSVLHPVICHRYQPGSGRPVLLFLSLTAYTVTSSTWRDFNTLTLLASSPGLPESDFLLLFFCFPWTLDYPPWDFLSVTWVFYFMSPFQFPWNSFNPSFHGFCPVHVIFNFKIFFFFHLASELTSPKKQGQGESLGERTRDRVRGLFTTGTHGLVNWSRSWLCKVLPHLLCYTLGLGEANILKQGGGCVKVISLWWRVSGRKEKKKKGNMSKAWRRRVTPAWVTGTWPNNMKSCKCKGEMLLWHRTGLIGVYSLLFQFLYNSGEIRMLTKLFFLQEVSWVIMSIISCHLGERLWIVT